MQLLEAGVDIAYFDHHHAGEIPTSKRLNATIDTDASTCTGLIVESAISTVRTCRGR